jgi:hypothetical protein
LAAEVSLARAPSLERELANAGEERLALWCRSRGLAGRRQTAERQRGDGDGDGDNGGLLGERDA